jgi:acyl-CoA synthetase (AMP-forming)/AMP-acid ligase II
MIEASSLWGLIEARAKETPDALFVVDDRDRRSSFGLYRDQAEGVAATLLQRGIARGSRVSWMIPTRIEAMVLMGALSRLGAIQNPILPIYRRKETRFVLEQTKAELFITPTTWRGFDYEEMSRALAGELPGLEVLAVDLELPHRTPSALPAPERDAGGDVRWIYYTSGTTSDPKGVRHTDRTLLSAAEGLARALEITERDRAVIPFPLAHVGGALWLMVVLMSGCAAITVEVFDARSIEVLAKNSVTLAGAGTFFHQAYLEAQRSRGSAPLFPQVRACHGGGAPKPPGLHLDIKRELGGVGIVSGYGLTECPALTMNTVRCEDEKLANTEGRAASSKAQIRIVKGDGTLAQAGEEGEVRARGPQLFKGYVDSAHDRDAFDADGFLRTGDLGKVDDAGYLTITGRLKDIIIRKGENISAKEVEDMLYTHPKVRDAAVIGLPDPRLGERCCAVVVVRDAADPLSFEEMTLFLLSHGLMKQKLPEQLELLGELPRNANGKIQKNALRERFR